MIDACMGVDRDRLHKRLRGLVESVRVSHQDRSTERRTRRKGLIDRDRRMPTASDEKLAPPPPSHGLQGALSEIEAEIKASMERRSRRLRSIPAVHYPSDLPVCIRREEIADAMQRHQVIVVCGETGSGKSTQLPKICLELGRGIDGLIGHTQPRRIAARTIAARLSEELRVVLGQEIGFKIRFNDRTDPNTLIKVMTDGILLAETASDRLLRQYDTLIIDEAHERSLNIDFLLGYLRQILPKRPDLKVVVTSATIDPERLSRHFSDAPIVRVEGRTYPVETRYRPLPEQDDRNGRDDDVLLDGILNAVDEIAAEGPGDILVFLSGEREIREAAEGLRKHHPPNTEVLPLYARLSVEEQQRVFTPHNSRRIVLATNVAETSLTVPGIRGVVDTGVARISRYSPRTKVQRLQVEPISRASADQRRGRCGRIGPGVCLRLYSEESYSERPDFTEPEILRSHLAGVILQMKSLGLGKVEQFPFLDAPDYRQVREGYRTLHELGAVTSEGDLTPMGRLLAKLPIDPRIGRMVLAGGHEGVLHDVLIIAAALSVQDPRERPHDRQEQADALHAEYQDADSDFVSYLNLWAAYRAFDHSMSTRQLRRWCRERCLSFLRLREWRDVHRQLRDAAHTLGFAVGNGACDRDRVHKALLTGLLSNVGARSENTEYRGPHGLRFYVHPGSAVFDGKPAWIMAAELIQTTRLYARIVAKIRPEWIESAAEHLIKRTYHDPFWDARRARVHAYEHVTLHGLEIVHGREVHYGPIDPALSREIFIQKALVDGDLRTNAPWARHNRKLLREVSALEDRLRRRDIVAGPETRQMFFNARVPDHVFTGAAFERWRQQAERTDPRRLFMSHDDVVARMPGDEEQSRFPVRIEVDGATIPAAYRFEPGQPDDGVVLTVPLEALHRLNEAQLEWIIPGLVRERVIALVKSLPKTHRRLLGSAAAFADEFLDSEPDKSISLPHAINEYLRRSTGEAVADDIWRRIEVPDHLLPMLRVVDANNVELARGRNLAAVRRAVAEQTGDDYALIADERFRRDGIVKWDFDCLPERVEIRRRSALLEVYPALVDQGRSVSIRAFDCPHDAAWEHARGFLRLVMIEARDELCRAVRSMPELEHMQLLYSMLGSGDALREALCLLLAERAYLHDARLPRTRKEYEALLASGSERLDAASLEVMELVSAVLAVYQHVSLDLERRMPPAWDPCITDMRTQLSGLVYPGFLLQTPMPRLAHLPRYLQGIRLRLKKIASGGLDRDLQRLHELQPHLDLLHQVRSHSVGRRMPNHDVEQYRWMIEEMRVSMYAQDLRTAFPISLKRLAEHASRLPQA
ncbi:MAG: ATP-dependent RNA helicase HrpA [Phycisphaeraceae bacterium]|nr:ATP-dependent RNA helicase HrpA [Phycisphaeraceae bacterium]